MLETWLAPQPSAPAQRERLAEKARDEVRARLGRIPVFEENGRIEAAVDLGRYIIHGAQEITSRSLSMRERRRATEGSSRG